MSNLTKKLLNIHTYNLVVFCLFSLHYSGYCLVNFPFVYQTFTIYGLLFQIILLESLNQLCSPNPKFASKLGLGSSAFARHYYQNRFFFLFLQVLRCFSSLRSLPMYYFTHTWISQLLPNLSSLIRISMGHKIFAPYHSFSQLITSFFGSWCLGIHPMLLVA